MRKSLHFYEKNGSPFLMVQKTPFHSLSEDLFEKGPWLSLSDSKHPFLDNIDRAFLQKKRGDHSI